MEELRERGVAPFHWEIEFPEVFGEGFSAVVGNPPFMKGGSISGILGGPYRDFLKESRPDTHGNADYVAHFFRHGYELIGSGGTAGFISTNTISQGDTRNSSLGPISLRFDGVIYDAIRRLQWPGLAAVIVSVVHIRKAKTCLKYLDGIPVSQITPFLFSSGTSTDPIPLTMGGGGLSFSGPKLYGVGFCFDDSDTTGLASSLSTMNSILRANPTSADVIFPLLGGKDLSDLVNEAPTRYAVNLGEISLDRAWAIYPEIMDILEKNVKPERAKVKDEKCRDQWWLYERPRPELAAAKAGHERVLVHPFTCKHMAFQFVNSDTIVPAPHNIFIIDHRSGFCVVQSRVHEVWVRFFGSSLKDDLRYTASQCFEPFPFPKDWQSNQSLESAGQTYYDYRAALMLRNDEGLTKTYNRFHDPDETSAEIVELRNLHAAMDRAVLEAYGWHDLAERATCEFQLEYEEPEDDEDDDGRTRKKKKPWRYKWPQDFHDEVLARLLELNQQYAEEERLAGKATAPAPKQAGKKKSATKKTAGEKTPAKKAGKKAPKQVPLLGDED
ncbi:Eco57I restriction-modification methylase domain-containing protein [Nannocystaceae bacterium ST9]